MFAPACYPPDNPEAFVNANLVTAIIERGWQIDVITMPDSGNWYPVTHSSWSKLESCAIPIAEKEKTLINSLSAALGCVSQSGHIVDGGRWALPAAQRALQLIEKNHHDFIMSRALPSNAHLAAFIVARKTKIPWIANWNDPVPWEKFPKEFSRGAKGKDANLGCFVNAYYKDVVQTAAWHTFPCERLRKYVANYLPEDILSKSSVIPHIALNKLNQCSDNNVFTIMHAGSLGQPRSPHNFLKGVKLFCDRINSEHRVSVVFIVDKPESIISSVKDYDLENIVSIEEPKPYSEMPSVIGKADLLVIIEALVDEGIFLPSKFVDYVASGKPILAVSPATGTLVDIIGEHGGGLAVDSTKPIEIADALHSMYIHWKNGTLYKSYSSAKLYPLFAKYTVLNMYSELFSKLGKNNLSI